MKSIGFVLDQMQILIGAIPRKLETQNDVARATAIIDEVVRYENVLLGILQNSDLKKKLYALEHSTIEGFRVEAHEIEKVLNDLSSFLYELNNYIATLRNIVANNPAEWSHKADQLTHIIYDRFNTEMGELLDVFKLSLHTEQELRSLVTDEPFLSKFLEG